MDGSKHSISSGNLSARPGFEAVRCDADFSGAEKLVAPAVTATDSVTRFDSIMIASTSPAAQQS
jgi:hypothetical protein